MHKINTNRFLMTKWVFSIFFIVLFLINSAGIAFAQEETPTPSSSPETSEEPTQEITPSPDPTQTPEASPTETETLSPTPEPTATPEENGPALREPRPLDESGANLAHHSSTGKVNFIGASFDAPIQNPLTAGLSAAQGLDMMMTELTPEVAARAFLSEYGHLFGLSDQSSELVLMRTNQPDERRSIVRFQQQYQGIPVFAGELVVQMDAAGSIVSANGEILPDINLSTQPGVSAQSAQDAARLLVSEQYGIALLDLQVEDKGLWIFNPILIKPGEGSTSLVWRMEVTPSDTLPVYEIVLIDAASGDIALHFNQAGGAKVIYTYDMQGSSNWSLLTNGTYFVCDQSDLNCTNGGVDAKSAHKTASDFYDFFYNYHNRQSFDNASSALISSVNFGSTTGFENGAFWNGSQAIFGTGYARADDIVAHEFTHGFIQHTSGLYNYYQSGAIAESLSDMWGEFIDLTNGRGNDDIGVRWLIGEDNPGGAVRSMSDPTLYNDPDMMTSAYYYTGTADNGGIHTNSGVNNKAVSLLVDGLRFNNETVSPLGIAKVASIYYEAQTNLLTSGSDYLDLHNVLYQACLNLIGTTVYDQSLITIGDCGYVRLATTLVQMDQQPTSGLPFEADPPYCQTTDQPTYIFNDDLESGTTNWTMGVIPEVTGLQAWDYRRVGDMDFSAHSGISYLFADGYITSSDSYVSTSWISIPALDSTNGGFLYFYHQLDLDNGGDGGVVEYCTQASGCNEETDWIDVIGDGWTADNGYNGTSTEIGGAAFTGNSAGYIGTRVQIPASLASQNIRLRWRFANNSSGSTLGWWLDDVRVYTCNTVTHVPAGKYDDDDRNTSDETIIQYSSGWALVSDSAYYEETLHRTSTNGSTATLSFYGTKVSVLYSKGTSRGKFNVYIDGTYQGQIDQLSTTTEEGWVWYSGYIDNDTNPNNTLQPANHVLQLVFVGSGSQSGLIDAIQVEDIPEPIPVIQGWYDDADYNVVLKGNWQVKPYVISAYNSTGIETNDPNATLTVTFYARRIGLLFPKFYIGGNVQVYLDGTLNTTINQYDPGIVQGHRWTQSPLYPEIGQHVMEVRLAPGQPSSKRMAIDAVLIPDPGSRTSGTYDDKDLIFFFTGQWLAKTGGDYFMATRQQTSVSLSQMKMAFTGNHGCLIYPGGPDRGVATIKIDAIPIATVNQYWSSVRYNMLWCTDEIAPKSGGSEDHSFSIQFTEGQTGKIVFVDGVIIGQKTVKSTNGTYDDRDSSMVYVGYWLMSTGKIAGAYNETLIQTQNTSAKLKFYFSGGKIGLIYPVGPQGGLVDVFVDSVKVTTLNQYNSSTIQNVSWISTSTYSTGEHVVEFRLASGQASGKTLSIDAITISGN